MQSIEWNIIRNEKTKYFIYYVENEEIIWSCNLLEKEKNNTKYLYAPRGPVLKNSNFDLINLFLIIVSPINYMTKKKEDIYFTIHLLKFIHIYYPIK